MSQGFLAAEPVTGGRTFGSLYAILRTNFQALQSAHSGTTWPASPIGGQLCWRTDYSPRKLFIYNDLGSTWDEMVLATAGLGLELIAARGAHASLDARLDAQINEDGTFKASTASGLNPSQWYDLTIASGWVSTTSFKAMAANYTSVYHPTRRLKVNRDTGAYYTEVVSSSYGAPDTTVLTRDAVCGASQAAFRNVSHSIIAPIKAGAGDGAVSYEMVANRNVVYPTSAYTVLANDSVIMASGSFNINGIAGGSFGPGRPLLVINIGTVRLWYNPGAYSINGSTSLLSLYPNQSLLIFPDGNNWRTGGREIEGHWMDFSASSSPVGWASLTSNYVMYRVQGSIVFVTFYIAGTGNSDNPTYCSLPFASKYQTGAYWFSAIRGIDNGTSLTTPARATVAMDSPLLVFNKDFSTTAWTTSGTKSVQGSIWYEIGQS